MMPRKAGGQAGYVGKRLRVEVLEVATTRASASTHEGSG